jgi:glycosyltransferase A (GT-A) superfamily protein (DUF2064 family)
MGTGRVFAETVARVAALGLRAAVQPETFDVDEWEDVLALRNVLGRDPTALPHTRAALAALC